ncbi:hypothetical protein CAPTEDRAFT_157837 [Capitella teleta]|uniref:Uncharacterized protein n=1 Tax=Capitella teleta TaxID=283909 RepID=R7V9Z9_CAPTE|nr:hypothetical protein CAPTEDRAFT_157837 [Capitella teleta]|eukprot:ELU15429.1 hypothetical protein CAPTEDRAFT_157837 [Capitella teleta]
MNGLTTFYTGGTTNAAAAISTMREDVFTEANGDRPDVKNVGIVFLDGQTDDTDETWHEAITNRDAGIQMMAVGIGAGAKQSELETIGSYPTSANVFTVRGFDNLMDIQDSLLDALCDDVNECDSGPCPEGAECRDLVNSYECICPAGTQGVNCERACTSMLDIIYVIDSSGSIRSERFPFILDWIIDMIEDLDIGPDQTRVGAIKFSDSATVEFNLKDFNTKQDVISAISKIQFSGGRTHTSASMDLLMNSFSVENGGREGANNIVIVLTDGNSNINADATVPKAIQVRESGVHVIVVGIGDSVNRYEMEGIASDPPAETVFKATSYRDLPDIVDELVNSVCDDVDYCESNPCQNGGVCVDQLKKYECNCAIDYTGRNCERRCTRSMDVAFLLDFSGDLGSIYDSILDTTAEIVFGLPIGSDRARVANLYLVKSAAIDFYLDTYERKSSILNALSYKTAGTSNNFDFIKMMYENVFVSSRGDRPGINNVGILVTDGQTNGNSAKLIQRANEAKALGIEMYVVAVGENVNMAEINGVASNPTSEHVIIMDSIDSPENVANQVLDQLCA